MSDAPPPEQTPEHLAARWPWVLLVMAVAWSVLIRLPLVLNAASHLDSDLAVDGLALLDATRGHFRWHYPGTPFIGIGPVVLSLPQALAFGATPVTLVSGGTLASVLLIVATFGLAWRAYGRAVAAWSLVPLTFASNGAVWLSGRITGGHLVAAVWHAGAFYLLAQFLRHGGRQRAVAFGLWCGFGYYLDSMFVVSLAGVATAATGFWLVGPRHARGLVFGLLFAVGFLAGELPRLVGVRLDPYSCYEDQFRPVDRLDVLAEHAELLARSCLPRLIAGHGLPGLETDPPPSTLNAPGPARTMDRDAPGIWAWGVTYLSLGLWMVSIVALLAVVVAVSDRIGRWVAVGLLVSVGVTIAGFVMNRNIYNSDNYRYLVGLLVPWALGFGLVMDRMFRRGAGGTVVATGLTLGLAVLMTGDLHHWYARFGWIDAAGRPVRRGVDDAVLAWLAAHPEVTWVEGGYWDVYRLAFLRGGHLQGAPFPVYPNRFPEWTPGQGGVRVLVGRTATTPVDADFVRRALAERGRVVLSNSGIVLIERP